MSAVKKSSPIRGKGFRNPSKAVRESASKPAKTSYNALKVSNYDVMIAPGNEFSLGKISTKIFITKYFYEILFKYF